MINIYHFYTSCKSADKIIVLFLKPIQFINFHASLYPILPWDIILDRVENRTLQNKTVREAINAFQRR
jgi:hypothetical protein